MEIIYAIAEAINIPNEFIIIEKIIDDCIWFRTTAGAQYSARTVRNGRRLKKNSIRPE